MTENAINQQKEQFLSLCRQYIKRAGIDELLAWLDTTDFYRAPSSTRFHLNEEGGLCRHVMNVFDTAMKIYKNCAEEPIAAGTSPFTKPVSEESIAIACLFHDLCKVGVYRRAEKFRKNDKGQWETYLSWEMQESFPIGHAEKSLMIVRKYMELNLDEALAIRWHMGMFDVGESGSFNRRAFYDATELSPLVCIVSSADFVASKCLEKTTEY
ncbi:MAG: HD domain-containing protein [Bacteroidaceae bacterium]|nr:HD domain-containing protein [Candidatus Equimonas faecalis]MCQ2206228.1 HD domain-containing protein [Bacteroidaceae bacterium]